MKVVLSKKGADKRARKRFKRGMLFWTFFLFLFTFLIHCGNLKAQATLNIKTEKKVTQYWHEFIRLTTESGLSSNTITAIEQDTKGFIWIGTDKGLCRYDGKTFTHYRTQLSAKVKTAEGFSQIYAGKNGRIYFRTSQQAGFIDYGLPTPHIFTGFNEKVSYLTYSNTGNKETLLLLKAQTLYKIEIGGTEYIIEDSLRMEFDENDKPIFTANQSGEFWVIHRGNVERVDWANHRLQVVKKLPKESPSVFTALVDSKGWLWLGGWIQENSTNLLVMPTVGEKAFTFFHPLEELDKSPEKKRLMMEGINYLSETEAGDIWIGTRRDGAYCIKRNAPEKELLHFVYEPNEPKGLSGNRVTAVKVDERGGLWIGLESFGINFLPIQHKPFSLLRQYPLKKNSLSNNYIRSIYRARSGELWVCTQFGGVNRVSLRDERVWHYNQTGKLINVWAIEEREDGKLIAGFNGPLSGLYLIDPKRDTSDSQFKKIANLERTYVIQALGDTQFLIGGEGLWLLKSEEGKPSVLQKFGESHLIKMGLINDVFIETKDSIWVAAEEGLFLFDRKGNIVQQWHEAFDGNEKQAINNICGILVTQNGERWFTSKGNGILKLEGNQLFPSSYFFKESHQTFETPSMQCYGILEDKNGWLWVSSDGGIFSFNPRSKEKNVSVRQYQLRDGLQGHEFNRRAFHKDAEGRLYFGGTNGLNYFFPEQIERDSLRFRVAIGGMKLFEKELDFSGDRNLNFDFDENYLSLSLSEFSFQPLSSIKFYYSVNGNLLRETNGNTLSFLSLEPGYYDIKVKGISLEGIESCNEARLQFAIHPPIYKTVWAYALYAILLGLGILLFIQFRIRRIQQENERLERLVAVRTKDLVEANSFKARLMEIAAHDLRNPLQSIFGFARLISETDEVSETKSFAKNIEKSSKQMVGLVEELLERNEARELSVKLNPVSLDHIVKEAVEKWQGSANVKRQRLEFYSKDGVEGEALLDESKTFQVLDNLISNAIKYTEPGGTIQVKVNRTKTAWFVRVEDNGQGLSEEDRHRLFQKGQALSSRPTNGEESHGIGLSIAKELVLRQGGKIWAESEGKGKGTAFIISFPLKDGLAGVD
ncbi:MAG: two-component regulator propeller domain-containing protein [Chloroherpetonaceae bacterium]|nr:two-component regulator propeller domain-containing protein [Chloroherpetonaceae bacterium]